MNGSHRSAIGRSVSVNDRRKSARPPSERSAAVNGRYTAFKIDSGAPRSATAPAQLALDRAIAAETGGGRDDEHQLWYVALTRARYAALIVVSDPDDGASPVTRAIIESTDPRLTVASHPLEAWLERVREAVPCPCCGTGRMRGRGTSGRTRHFAACTNWNGGEGCDYTQPSCSAAPDHRANSFAKPRHGTNST